jgi:hypothetical protein
MAENTVIAATPVKPAATDRLVTLEPREFSSEGPIVIHPTQQHAISYSISEEQLNLLGAGSVRFTILSNVCGIFFSSGLTCFLSGLTLTAPLSAPQIATFEIAPIVLGVAALASGVLATLEFRNYGKLATRIASRSYEPGTKKSLAELQKENV